MKFEKRGKFFSEFESVFLCRRLRRYTKEQIDKNRAHNCISIQLFNFSITSFLFFPLTQSKFIDGQRREDNKTFCILDFL